MKIDIITGHDVISTLKMLCNGVIMANIGILLTDLEKKFVSFECANFR